MTRMDADNCKSNCEGGNCELQPHPLAPSTLRQAQDSGERGTANCNLNCMRGNESLGC